MSAKDIIYMVKRPPKFGYLEVDPPITGSEESIANKDSDSSETFDQFSPASGVTVFDQEIINEGRLHYIQSISNQVKIFNKIKLKNWNRIIFVYLVVFGVNNISFISV